MKRALRNKGIFILLFYFFKFPMKMEKWGILL